MAGISGRVFRTDVGTITQTDFGYTAQRTLDAQGNSYRLGLMDYKARFYDPYLHHFVQPDTLPAGGLQGLNRYSYGLNNPLSNSDPSGHMVTECEGRDDYGGRAAINPCIIHHDLPICETPSGTSIPQNPTSHGEIPSSSIRNDWSGYKGEIPDNLGAILEAHGASKELIESVYLQIGSGGFGCRSNYVAVTYFNDINYCMPENFNPNYPDEWLVHELVHVRQNRDYGVIPLIENQFVLAYQWVNNNLGGYYNPYNSFWVEVEAGNCQDAFHGDPTIPLNQSPCMIR